MPGLTDGVATVNSLIRTVLALVVVGGISAAGYVGWTTYNASELQEKELENARNQLKEREAKIARMDGQINTLNQVVKEKDERIEHLDTALRLLKVDKRVARLTILDQGQDEESKRKFAIVQFEEIDKDGKAIDKPRKFKVFGDIIYIDSWVVKFDDKYVEQAEIHRSTSLVLFRRIFGNQQKPDDGFKLDEVGSNPSVYSRGGKTSDLQRKIFSDFWSVANNKTKQKELGIRAAHGEAPNIKVEKGKTYLLNLRSSGGVSLDHAKPGQTRIEPET